MCFFMCLALGIRWASHKTNSRRELMKWLVMPTRLAKIKKQACEFVRVAGLNVTRDRGVDRADMVRVACSRLFKNKYTIKIYADRLNASNRVTVHRANAKDTPTIDLFLLHDGEHFILILDKKKFFGCNYCCVNCDLPYNSLNHKCEDECIYCRSPVACERGVKLVKCGDCNRLFQNADCFARHKVNKLKQFSAETLVDASRTTVCHLLQICPLCSKYVDYRKRLCRRTFDSYVEMDSYLHTCSEGICGSCKQLVGNLAAHKCFIQKYKKEMPEKFVLTCFDIESMLVLQNNDDDDDDDAPMPSTSTAPSPPPRVPRKEMRTHVPNVLCCERICHNCVNELASDYHCSVCAPRQHTFVGHNCVNDFLNEVLHWRAPGSQRQPHQVVMAHNSGAYDSMFIVRALLDMADIEFSIVLNGYKVLLLTVMQTIFFKDLFSYLPLRLASFGATFGLSDCVKGFYPYLFNQEANLHYKGPIPSKSFFLTSGMDTKTRKEFDVWYDAHANDPNYEFDNYNLILFYCRQDVFIMRRCAVILMQQFIELFDFNILFESFRLASASFTLYRKLYMPEKSMAIIKHSKVNQSLNGRLWLLYESSKLERGRKIKNEYKLATGLTVDGYLESENTHSPPTVYEFLGCIFHGCSKCFTGRDLTSVDGQNDGHFVVSMHGRREAYLHRRQRLVRLNVKIVEMWNCEFEAFLRKNPRVKSQLMDRPEMLYNTLHERNGLFGGRCEPFLLYYKTPPQGSPPVTLRYLDFVSLYPHCLISAVYPVGWPIKQIKGVEECRPYLDRLDTIHGMISCLLQPPTDLLYPLIPYRANGKLIFGLCRRCIESVATDLCTHSDRERALFGTWTIVEIAKAQQLNYRILEAHEIWIYDTMQFDKNVPGSSSLFSNYALAFLKQKLESSGYPASCDTEEKKKFFLADCLKHEGIALNPDRMVYNSGLRAQSKLFLNSLWGRVCMRPPESFTEVITSHECLDTFLSLEGISVTSVIAGDSSCLVNWKYRNADDVEYRSQSSQTCPIVGCYTTAQARLTLYREIEKLPPNSLAYCDTDSLVFVDRGGGGRDGGYKPNIGSFLGQMSDEIADKYGSSAYISEFLCSGPKAYGLMIRYRDDPDKVDEVIKFKGYRYNSSNPLTFDRIKQMVLGGSDKTGSIPFRVRTNLDIRRDKNFGVHSMPTEKLFQFTFAKRVCPNKFDRTVTELDSEITCINTVPFGYRPPHPAQ